MDPSKLEGHDLLDYIGRQPCMRQYQRDMQRVLGYKLSREYSEIFQKYHACVVEKLGHWREDDRLANWYMKQIAGVLDDVQKALACVCYHRDNIQVLEREFQSLDSLKECMELLKLGKFGGGSMAGGNSLKLDFEYQAFVLSARRCLDYLTLALGAYFKNTWRSFHDLPGHLRRLDTEMAKGLLSVYEKHAANFGYLMSDGTNKTVRDRLTHHGYIDAGTINVNSQGFLIAGGGEELAPVEGNWRSLSEVLNKRTEDIHSCVSELLAAFIDFVEKDLAAIAAKAS